MNVSAFCGVRNSCVAVRPRKRALKACVWHCDFYRCDLWSASCVAVEADGMTQQHLSLNNAFSEQKSKIRARNELKSLVLQAAQGNCFSEAAFVTVGINFFFFPSLCLVTFRAIVFN